MKKNQKKLSEPVKTKRSISSFLKRRPHRSFKMTRKRDYKRSLELPGNIAFTKYVFKTLWSNRNTFALLALVYGLVTLFLVGIASQDTYITLEDTLNTTSGEAFNSAIGGIGKAGLLFLSSITGNLSGSLSEGQQIYAGFALILTWLTTVWLLRNILAGHKVKLRDGIYNAGAPIFPTCLVALLFIVQLLPFAIALIIMYAASATGLLEGGAEAMLCWFAAGLLTIMSIYWIVSTFFALIIITLPGMYPMRAIRAAGDLVVGRRMRIILRFVWMFFVTILVWAIIMIPVIMFNSWLREVWSFAEGIPIIPILLLALSSLSIIWISSYVYLLYRKVVADDSDPA